MAKARTRQELRQFAEEFAALIEAGHTFGQKIAPGSDKIAARSAYAQRHKLSKESVSNMIARARAQGFAGIWEKAVKQQIRNERTPLRLKPVNAEAARRRVVIMTSAQDETPLHEPFWANLKAYARHRRAEIYIGGFTYQKGLFEDHSVETGKYVPAIMEHLRPIETRLAPRLVWAGQANILPTSSRPLVGWQSHGGASWVVLPHAKIQLESVSRMPGQPPKAAVSTGVCTLPNYVKRAAGMKAEWHHTFGFAIAEIEADGEFWVRTVSAEESGAFQDLDIRVADGRVTEGCHVEAITWGDIHVESLDPEMARLSWGLAPDGSRLRGSSMVDVLQPRFQFFHDLINFSARSHHTIHDPVFMTEHHAQKQERVADELALAARFINASSRAGCESIVVDSNHNQHFCRWLRSSEGRTDPANADFWHRVNARWHQAAREGDTSFSPFAWALTEAGAKKFVFVRAGDSFTICDDVGPIECGLHGHAGPNGSRGSARSLARIAPRVNAGHTHSPAIDEGCYIAGANCDLRPRFVNGPSSWAHADIVTMPSGKRQIVFKNSKGWRGR
jgi:hypothetical protein